MFWMFIGVFPMVFMCTYRVFVCSFHVLLCVLPMFLCVLPVFMYVLSCLSVSVYSSYKCALHGVGVAVPGPGGNNDKWRVARPVCIGLAHLTKKDIVKSNLSSC
jgi:hypothetical protein